MQMPSRQIPGPRDRHDRHATAPPRVIPGWKREALEGKGILP